MIRNDRSSSPLFAWALSALLFTACGGSSPANHPDAGTAGGDGAAGNGGAPGGRGGSASGGSGGASTGGSTTGGTGGSTTGGTGGSTTGGSGGSTTGGSGGSTTGGSGGSTTGGTGGSTADAGQDATVDMATPAPQTTIATSAIDFGHVDCGTSGGVKMLSFTNSGNAPLTFRAAIAPGGTFSLQNAIADGSLGGTVAPGAVETLTIVAATLPTTTASGALLHGTLAITTDAAGAEDTQISIVLTAQGNACTLGCGSLTQCMPTGGSPYCANTQTDSANCGSCGNVCGAGQVCSAGVCTLSCGSLTKCAPSTGAPYCANTQTDNADCGTCGNACGAGQVCGAGVCTITCGSLTTCTPTSGAPYCANAQTDNANCGTCGNACGAGQVCTAGVCTITCGSLTTCTPTSGAPYCANTQTDNADCGSCGRACGPGQVCSGGSCTLTCGSLTKCTPPSASPYCVNTTTDNNDCGSCGHACGPGQACIMSTCTTTCSGSQTICGGMCTNTAYDPSNCGACGQVCGFSQGSAACVGSACFLTSCNPGYADCNHSQTDGCEVSTNTDVANCGACGHTCALGETCNLGVCTANLSAGLIGYWNMNDPAGSTAAADSSGNHLDAQAQGPVMFVPGAGKQGTGAVRFGGVGYLRAVFPNNVKGQGAGISIPLGNITFAMWFQTSAANVGGLQVVEGGTWGMGCDRVVGNGNGPQLNYNAWSEVNMSGGVAVNDGAWHQLVYVLDENTGLRAYIDGVLDASSVTPTSNCGVGCSGFDWASEYWIGRSAGCRFNADYFVGLVDDVRLYDHVLSPTAVVQLYNATR